MTKQGNWWKLFCRASGSTHTPVHYAVEAVESRLLFSGLAEHRGVNDQGDLGFTSQKFATTGGTMDDWNVDIVRENIFEFDKVSVGTGDVISHTIGDKYVHGLQAVVNDLNAHIEPDPITILCPFTWDGQQVLATVPSNTTYWTAYKSKLHDMAVQFSTGNPNVWLEVWNEPYAENAPATYVSDMQQMITAIRSGTGYTGKIVIPGANYGGNEAKILSDGQALVDFDPQHNIVFDLHAYNDFIYGKTSTQIENRIQGILNTGVDLIFGEYGPQIQPGTGVEDVSPFLTAVKNKHVTALAWHWEDGDVNTLHNSDGTMNNTAANYNWANQVKAYTQGARSNLPAGWTESDIGGPLAGSTSYVGSAWTVRGSGADIVGTSDQFHFTRQPVWGNGTITARVSGVQYTNTYAKGGVMFRDGTAANAPMASLVMTAGGALIFQTRTTAGATATSQSVTGISFPQYVRIVRSGNTFTAYYGSSKTALTQLGTPVTITMAANVNAGLAATSHDATVVGSANFDNVSVFSSGPPLVNTNIGGGTAGSTTYNGKTWTVTGGGADIYGTSDQFNFAQQSFTGNGTAIARVYSLQNTNIYAKAGVMFRDGLAANAPYVALLVTATQGLSFQYRTAAGAATTVQAVTGISAPQYLKLVRVGNNFTAYYSSDGTNYTQINTTPVTVTMAATVRAGLAVTSHNTSQLTTAEIDNVSIV